MGRRKTIRERLGEDLTKLHTARAQRRKEKFSAILIENLSDPGTRWPPRTKLKNLLNIANVYNYFTAEELDEIEYQALENRRKALADIRKSYTVDIIEIDKTVLKKAKGGSLGHAHLAYDRFEGPVATIMEVTGAGGKPLAITSFPPTPESLAEWEEMIKNTSRPKSEDADE